MYRKSTLICYSHANQDIQSFMFAALLITYSVLLQERSVQPEDIRDEQA